MALHVQMLLKMVVGMSMAVVTVPLLFYNSMLHYSLLSNLCKAHLVTFWVSRLKGKLITISYSKLHLLVSHKHAAAAGIVFRPLLNLNYVKFLAHCP